MKMKKVAIIDPIGVKAGMDSYDCNLLASLARMDIDGLLYSNFLWNEFPEKSFPFFSESIGHSLSGIFLLPLKYLKIIRHAKLKSCGSIIIHVFHFNRMDEWVLEKIKIHGMKTIVIVHDVESFISVTNSIRLKRVCEKLADVLVVHNNYVSEELSKRISKEAAERIHVIPHGDFLNLASGSLSKEQARKKLGLNPEKKIGLFFGMIKETKGLDTLLHAWKNVAPDVSLIIAGRLRNISFRKYQEIIDLEPASQNIHLMLRQIKNEERNLLFRAADLVVLPYRRIYQSGVLLLSMSYGVPVIVTRLKAFEEVLRHEHNALFVDVEDPDQLSEAISALLNDTELQERLSSNALKTIHTNHNWTDIAMKFSKFIS